MQKDQNTDLTKLRYVLYARKSTEDEGRQLRSIGDQIADCRKLAKELNLNIVAVVEEQKSAKRPHVRPRFNQLLKDVQAKKYDAILCWHPDRLSRNMLESGMIIDMLDQNILKDIRFHSHQFSNDANGKMLLGMLFVFSKQYSDDLSSKVSRGVKGNFSEGKSSGAPKWGYDRDEVTGRYVPNEYFDLVQQAWRMRENGKTVKDIVAYLIDNGYKRKTKPKKGVSRTILPNEQTAGKMFSDSFYYGLLVQVEQTINLQLVYDFEPMITEDTYNRVQTLGYTRTRDNNPKKHKAFYPLRRMVYCAVCNSENYMLVGKNKNGSGNYVLSYRCDNPECTRKTKSIRAHKVFDSLYDMLSQIQLSDEAYDRYSKQLQGKTDMKILAAKQSIESHRGALKHVENELKDLALTLDRHELNSTVYKIQSNHIDELAAQRDDRLAKIAELETKIADPRKIMLSKDEFLNLVKTVADKMKAGSAVQKDVLSRILFLNVRVDDEKVVNYLWKEPFASLVKYIEINSGRGDRT